MNKFYFSDSEMRDYYVKNEDNRNDFVRYHKKRNEMKNSDILEIQIIGMKIGFG
jgi:hypothetical protein